MTMQPTIRVETCAPLIERELWPLLEQHREELTTNKAMMRLAPAVEMYAQLEEMGHFVGLIARVDGEIVGYSGNFLNPNLHYSDLLQAENDVLFVRADQRGTLGLRLMDATEREMRERGAQIMLWHAKADTALSQLLPKRGCRVQDVIYSKVL